MMPWERAAVEYHGRRICAAYPDVRVVICDTCGSEGRIYTSNGGPDETDHGPCPWCEGTGGELIPVEPIEMEDLAWPMKAD